MKVQTNIAIEEDIKKRIDVDAERLEMSRSMVIHRILRKYYPKKNDVPKPDSI